MTPDEEAHHLTDAAYKVPPAKLDTAALKARKYANINNFPALIMCYFDKQTQVIIQKLLPALLTIFNISETEFQARGWSHEHEYVKLRNQPTLYDYGVSHESNIATANNKTHKSAIKEGCHITVEKHSAYGVKLPLGYYPFGAGRMGMPTWHNLWRVLFKYEHSCPHSEEFCSNKEISAWINGTMKSLYPFL
jgi:hypothetical protein